ncbi:hypothetical protein V6N13_024581 [Hibiscus sabdariffa]
MRFGRNENLSPRFIIPYEVLERIGPIAYRLKLSVELERMHDIFHVSMSRRYRSDPSYVVSGEEIEFCWDLTYDEEPVEILILVVRFFVGRQLSL